jgi:nitrite reductase (NADH) large subunit
VRAEDSAGTWRIVVLAEEPRPAYDRVGLSTYVDSWDADALTLPGSSYEGDDLVELHLGDRAVEIDPQGKVVTAASGLRVQYDALVLATGSSPFVPPVPGKDLPGCFVYRTIDDLISIREWCESDDVTRGVVIGGGLLGLEAAAALRLRGMEVVVLHLMGHLMERQLDPAAGYLLQKELEGRGIRIHTKAQTKAILGHERVEAVALDDGTVYPADIVVMAVGIRPETRIATDAGLHVERGIVVSDQMITSDPDVLAVGECVEHERPVYGLVAPLYDMAKVAAKTLVKKDAAFRPVQTATQLKVTGVSLYSAGDFAEAEGAGVINAAVMLTFRRGASAAARPSARFAGRSPGGQGRRGNFLKSLNSGARPCW